MHKEKHAATHMSCQNIQRENDEKGPCKHKAKYISNIKVVRIYGERKLRNGHTCIQNMVGVRNIWREKKKRRIWTHAYMQEYHMG
jgi:hypothetical protein